MRLSDIHAVEKMMLSSGYPYREKMHLDPHLKNTQKSIPYKNAGLDIRD